MILELDKDEAEGQLELERSYLLSLTTRQRFEMAFRESKAIQRTLLRYGHLDPAGMTKHPCH